PAAASPRASTPWRRPPPTGAGGSAGSRPRAGAGAGGRAGRARAGRPGTRAGSGAPRAASARRASRGSRAARRAAARARRAPRSQPLPGAAERRAPAALEDLAVRHDDALEVPREHALERAPRGGAVAHGEAHEGVGPEAADAREPRPAPQPGPRRGRGMEG